MADELAELSKPPLNVLLDPLRARSEHPWRIDIVSLLKVFLSLMEQRGEIDLRLCGSAALSSALLYRLKVESIFLFEKLVSERASMSALKEPPRIVVMPFRYELYSTSLNDLIEVLTKVMQEVLERSEVVRPRPPLAEAAPFIEIDPFISNVRELLSGFRRQISEQLSKDRLVSFRRLVSGMTLLEEVRTFILLLFLATEGLVVLKEKESDIIITSADYNA